jgi:phosphate transport system substrate-binding protein
MHRALAGVAALAVVTACGDPSKKEAATAGSPPAQSTSSGADLTGAGATFPYPLYSKWFSTYANKTGVKINYQSIGSGGGIRQLSEQTVDFGATDAPMTNDELAKAKSGPVMHIPTALGAVVVTYNLPEVTQPLKLSGDVVASIFEGQITKWNDARIAALNPGVTLPPTGAARASCSPTICRRSVRRGRSSLGRGKKCSGPRVWARRATRAWPAR